MCALILTISFISFHLFHPLNFRLENRCKHQSAAVQEASASDKVDTQMTATTTNTGQNVKVKVLTSKKMRKSGTGEQQQPGPTSLFIFGDNNPIRKLFKFIIEWPPFEYTVLVTIIATCVTMAMEEHLPDNDRTPLAMQLEEAEPVFLGIFIVEAACKIMANGLILHPNSYLRDVWNIMDFVVITSA